MLLSWVAKAASLTAAVVMMASSVYRRGNCHSVDGLPYGAIRAEWHSIRQWLD